jgi:hypothetical protein
VTDEIVPELTIAPAVACDPLGAGSCPDGKSGGVIETVGVAEYPAPAVMTDADMIWPLIGGVTRTHCVKLATSRRALFM